MFIGTQIGDTCYTVQTLNSDGNVDVEKSDLHPIEAAREVVNLISSGNTVVVLRTEVVGLMPAIYDSSKDTSYAQR